MRTSMLIYSYPTAFKPSDTNWFAAASTFASEIPHPYAFQPFHPSAGVFPVNLDGGVVGALAARPVTLLPVDVDVMEVTVVVD